MSPSRGFAALPFVVNKVLVRPENDPEVKMITESPDQSSRWVLSEEAVRIPARERCGGLFPTRWTLPAKQLGPWAVPAAHRHNTGIIRGTALEFERYLSLSDLPAMPASVLLGRAAPRIGRLSMTSGARSHQTRFCMCYVE